MLVLYYTYIFSITLKENFSSCGLLLGGIFSRNIRSTGKISLWHAGQSSKISHCDDIVPNGEFTGNSFFLFWGSFSGSFSVSNP